MPTIEDHAYVRICAQLANCLSISIAAARRKVDLAAAKEGVKDFSGRKLIAERLLKAANSLVDKGEDSTGNQLDNLLEALAEDENFMVED